MTEWNDELEKKILKKSKFMLTFRIVRTLLFIFLVYAGIMIVTNILSDKLNIANENMYFSSLGIEWTVPNVRGDLQMTKEDMSLLGNKRFSYNLIKKVGDENKVIGEVSMSERVNRFSSITFSHPGRSELSEFSFSLPEDPRINEKLEANTFPNVWETLEMLPEGTVGELAFSTNEFMESKQLVEALSDYDLHIMWMPLYTGEFVDYEPQGWSGSENMLMVSNVIGLTGGVGHDKDYNRSLQIHWLDKRSLSESEALMLQNMEELLDKSDRFYEDLLGLVHLEEQFNYLQTKGFTVYGAVVTGPVKELLKLKDLSFIQGEQLGEVELWNWDRNGE